MKLPEKTPLVLKQSAALTLAYQRPVLASGLARWDKLNYQLTCIMPETNVENVFAHDFCINEGFSSRHKFLYLIPNLII